MYALGIVTAEHCRSSNHIVKKGHRQGDNWGGVTGASNVAAARVHYANVKVIQKPFGSISGCQRELLIAKAAKHCLVNSTS